MQRGRKTRMDVINSSMRLKLERLLLCIASSSGPALQLTRTGRRPQSALGQWITSTYSCVQSCGGRCFIVVYWSWRACFRCFLQYFLLLERLVIMVALFIWGCGPRDFPCRGWDGDVWGLPLWGHGHVTGTCAPSGSAALRCAAC